MSNDQGLLAHTSPKMGVYPTIFDNEHSKIGFEFGVCTPITLGPGKVTSQNFFTWCDARQAW